MERKKISIEEWDEHVAKHMPTWREYVVNCMQPWRCILSVFLEWDENKIRTWLNSWAQNSFVFRDHYGPRNLAASIAHEILMPVTVKMSDLLDHDIESKMIKLLLKIHHEPSGSGLREDARIIEAINELLDNDFFERRQKELEIEWPEFVADYLSDWRLFMTRYKGWSNEDFDDWVRREAKAGEEYISMFAHEAPEAYVSAEIIRPRREEIVGRVGIGVFDKLQALLETICKTKHFDLSEDEYENYRIRIEAIIDPS